ncbi:MAG TPA: hypothetical protein VMP01_19685 [Pirellulaceae bacterium]|nr:hypothetical protein [Pirellulaceae bacterium]
MKLGKLPAAIRRELTANPKKAAVLALLLAAAAWFWGPIVWRNLGGAKPPAQGQAQVVNSELHAIGSVFTAKSKTQDTPKGNWRELIAARRQDPLARPATFDPQWPQPFKVMALAVAAGGETPATQVVLTPAQAGLVLESIVYGKTRRAAMINGEVYREGSEVAASAALGSAVTFQVVHIDRASVALERYGRTYRLEFPRPKLPQSQADQRSRSQNTPAAGRQP